MEILIDERLKKFIKGLDATSKPRVTHTIELLEKVGEAKKDTYYRKPGQKIPTSLFSRGIDNKIDKAQN